MSLSKDGEKFRNQLAEQGIEKTPNELEADVKNAINNISQGTCDVCGRSKEVAHGICYECWKNEVMQ